MSHASRTRNRVHFEREVARCASCIHYRPSLPYASGYVGKHRMIPFCDLNQFNTSPLSLCDLWKHRDGTVLDTATPGAS